VAAPWGGETAEPGRSLGASWRLIQVLLAILVRLYRGLALRFIAIFLWFISDWVFVVYAYVVHSFRLSLSALF
jgi:hypothetical protein